MEHLVLHKGLITLVNMDRLLQAVWNSLVSKDTEVCTNVLMSGRCNLDPCCLRGFPTLGLPSSRSSHANFSQLPTLFWCRLQTLGTTEASDHASRIQKLKWQLRNRMAGWNATSHPRLLVVCCVSSISISFLLGSPDTRPSQAVLTGFLGQK